MDAVELPLSAVAVSKLMGSDGGFGKPGVTVKELETRESDRVSIVASTSLERCSPLVSRKDAKTAVNASESAYWDKIPYPEIMRQANQPPRYQAEDVSERLNCRGATSSSLLLVPKPDGVQLQKKAGKVSRDGNGCSKRTRTAQMEDSMSEDGVHDANCNSDKLGSYPTKCSFPEKTQVIKQKNLNGKRGDKRNFKLPMKTKYDSFSPKAGVGSFSSAAGGNNILGLYGLKSDIHDVTKHLEEIPLNELLDGTYTCSKLGKDKGKKAANMNENILQSIKKSCSVIQLRRPVQTQNFSEIDASSSMRMSPSTLTSISCVASSTIDDGGDTNTMEQSCNKESCHEPETFPGSLEFPLYQPTDVLERLALSPPKDLQSLLLDAAKPALSFRNSLDSRPGKPISPHLPPFPWSHTFSGHYKTNSDAVKLSSSRSICQGRWTRIRNTASFLGIVNDCFTDLKSFTYDHSLVPFCEVKMLSSAENEVPPTTSNDLPLSEVPPVFFENSESGGDSKNEENADNCPRLLAAAQTLYDISTHSTTHNHPHGGIIRWPKKLSQKAMKARKLKSKEKPDEYFTVPKPVPMSENLVKSVDNQTIPSKKPKLSTFEKRKDLISWPAPRLCRSSPSKPIVETKSLNSRVLGNSPQKLRKVVPMDWKKARDKMD